MGWESFVDETLKPPSLTGLEEAPFEFFWDTFDVLNDGSGGADFKTASRTVYLNIDEGLVIFPRVHFHYEEYVEVWGTLVVECPFDIIRYKISSETPPEEVTKWREWAKSRDSKASYEYIDEYIAELLED